MMYVGECFAYDANLLCIIPILVYVLLKRALSIVLEALCLSDQIP